MHRTKSTTHLIGSPRHCRNNQKPETTKETGKTRNRTKGSLRSKVINIKSKTAPVSIEVARNVAPLEQVYFDSRRTRTGPNRGSGPRLATVESCPCVVPVRGSFCFVVLSLSLSPSVLPESESLCSGADRQR